MDYNHPDALTVPHGKGAHNGHANGSGDRNGTGRVKETV